MTSVLYVALDDSAPGLASLEALAVTVTRLDIGAADLRVSALRDMTEAAAPFRSLVLALGPGAMDRVSADDEWARRPLRRAFGVLTGAARRLVREGGGAIVLLMPASAVGPAAIATQQLVVQRSIVGIGEALRAELQDTGVRVSLVFYSPYDASLTARLAAVMAEGPMYSLSPDITAGQIDAYFAPLLDAVDRTSEGPPLPDIGPMAVVYDLIAAGAPLR